MQSARPIKVCGRYCCHLRMSHPNDATDRASAYASPNGYRGGYWDPYEDSNYRSTDGGLSSQLMGGGGF